ncbi:twin-arginine translocation signal domain-containing protein [Halobellus sp. Atlit-38R]|uniref:twin-arginine translocation signal domain-containing protein n=1 Tax=Halobellus sp. Atlit-38R TaxID=2282131 RepID=UPI000EF21AD6|nr:gluconate 2-dehydrogenase subunit 3 family protein [Halobellus sp. Atlit-38R]RLM84038.1 twin-arginine translocation signal domain-containing protein [Halobellus sp. Atlit-38R]
MELTRRDALAALAAVGATVGGGVLAGRHDPPRADAASDAGSGSAAEPTLSTDLLDLLDAAAEVVYPSGVDGRRTFVETYVLGRTENRPVYREGLQEAAAQLDAVARDWRGQPYADLDADVRDKLLRDLGVETAEPVADGTITERIRFYVVNDLLFAFYSSATGGRLVGIENPIGHPGGIESYQRASMSSSSTERSGGTNER